MSLAACITQSQFPSLSDADAVRLFAAEYEAELNYLKDAKSTVESGQAPPVGCLCPYDDTPSRLIFFEEFVEVNKTLLSMLALKWLLADDYESFTRYQRENTKLTRESFNSLRLFFMDRIHSSDDIYALLVSMVIEDVGKSPYLARQVKQTTGKTPCNHDEVVFLAAKEGMLPAVEGLSMEDRACILLSLELGSKLNLAQLAQGENVPGCLTALREFKKYQRAYDIRVMDVFLDIAGAGATTDTRCCGLMTDQVFQSTLAAIQATGAFLDGSTSSERECYDSVLAARANVLARAGFTSLSTRVHDERALLRLLAMARAMDKEHAALVKLAFERLPSSTRRTLVDELNRDGLSNDVAIIPYYAPGLIANALKNTTDGSDSGIVRVISVFMRFLARVLHSPRSKVGEGGRIFERDLSFAEEVIKSEDFSHNPDILDGISLPWER